jgi:hypothetical protein
VFDVFAEDVDGLVNGVQLAKRQRRAYSASSSVCTEQAPDTSRRRLVIRRRALRGSESGGGAVGWSRLAGSAHSWRATDTVGAGVRSQRCEDAVAAEDDVKHEVSADVQRGAAGGGHSPHAVVVTVAARR